MLVSLEYEDLKALMEDKERLDWLEGNLRSTGRGHITLQPMDYGCTRVGDLRADFEIVPGEFRSLAWPETRGRAHDLRTALDLLRVARKVAA